MSYGMDGWNHDNDLVRRKDVMDSMVKEYNRRFSLGERNGLRLAWIEKAVNEVDVAQPTDADIQKMQDIEQAMLEKAYECGREDAKPERKKGEWIEREVTHIDDLEAKDIITAWQSCKCSVCGRYDTKPYMYYFNAPKYCGWCGAVMEVSK